MDATRRANFASRQIRAGPAPLASFEDLPSDELESPEDFAQLPMLTSSALDDESSSQDMQFATPDSLTISSQSTPRIECDFDSHFTLTPADSYEGQSTAEMRTTSLSSLSKAAIPSMDWPKEATSLSVSQKKGSAQSLGNFDDPSKQIETNTRKSSWADIFRSNNQNSAKTSAATAPTNDTPVTESKHTKKKKSRNDLTKKEESKSKEKGKFLSMFKKKSNKNLTSPTSHSEVIVHSENTNLPDSIQNISEEVAPTKVTNGSTSKGKENELPKDIELCPTISEGQNDLGKVNTERIDKIPDERKISRKLINISEKSFEKEYNILTRQSEDKQLDLASKTVNIQAIVDEVEHESSESELVLESKEESVEEKKEDDFEAENLISLDMSEMDEDSVAEIRPMVIEAPKQVSIPSRQQRLEVTTKPIDRPRSTTPINVAPLEAFIQSVSPTFVAKVEKIKLSLPGEQFVGRVKSPKKSSVRSWTAFCESGLHSPRMHRRTVSEEKADPFSANDTQFSSDSDSTWAAFESNFEELDGFQDSFSQNGQSNMKSDGERSKFFSNEYTDGNKGDQVSSFFDIGSSNVNEQISSFFSSESTGDDSDGQVSSYFDNRGHPEASEQLSSFFSNDIKKDGIFSNKLSDPYQPFDVDFSLMSCSCTCHAYGCASCDKSKTLPEESSGPQACACGCHHQSKVLEDVDKRTFVSDGCKSYDAANVFDSPNRQSL